MCRSACGAVAADCNQLNTPHLTSSPALQFDDIGSYTNENIIIYEKNRIQQIWRCMFSLNRKGMNKMLSKKVNKAVRAVEYIPLLCRRIQLHKMEILKRSGGTLN